MKEVELDYTRDTKTAFDRLGDRTMATPNRRIKFYIMIGILILVSLWLATEWTEYITPQSEQTAAFHYLHKNECKIKINATDCLLAKNN